jgi:thioredoxin-dependent peroxiredoxin
MYRMTSFAVLALILTVSAAPLSAEELKVGDPAPEFELKASDGKTYKLSDFKGKSAVVIAWFPRAFTGGCTKECKSMRESGEKLREYDVAYFTASTDPVEKNADFAKSLDLDYPILSDPTGETAKNYGVYIADRNAAQRVTFYIGEDGKLQHIDRAVKTDTHGSDIATQLGKLGVEKK